MKVKIQFIKAESKAVTCLISHPSFPSWEKSAEIFRVHGLLYEQIHLSTNAEHGSLLYSFQFLLQSHQDTFSYFIETLVNITNDKNTKVLMRWNSLKGLGNRRIRTTVNRSCSPEISFAFLVICIWSGVELTFIIWPLL